MGGQVLGSLNIQPGGSHPSCGFWLPVWLYSLKKIIFFLSLKILVYLFLAVLGLCCCRQAFSSCGARPSCDGSSARGTVSRCTGSVVVALRLSCSEACGIFLDQGSNLCLLHWQVASYHLSHQGSPNTILNIFNSVQSSRSVLSDSLHAMDCSVPGFPVHYQLLELTQTCVHRVANAIQPSHPLSSPSAPAFSLSQNLGLFKWVSSSHQVAKVLEFQL